MLAFSFVVCVGFGGLGLRLLLSASGMYLVDGTAGAPLCFCCVGRLAVDAFVLWRCWIVV